MSVALRNANRSVEMQDMQRSRFSKLLMLAAGHRRLRSQAVRMAARLEGGELFSITAREILEKLHGVSIGAYSYGECFRPGVFPWGTTIGRYVSMAAHVRFFHRDHPIDRISMHPFFYSARLGFVPEDNIPSSTLEVGHDSWIGYRSMITSRCRRIGIGAVVAGGAVVTKDVPDFAIVGGNPAKLIRYRFSEKTREEILASAWWNLSCHEVARHMPRILQPVESDTLSRHPFLAELPPVELPLSEVNVS